MGPKVNVLEDKLVVPSMIRLKKRKGGSKKQSRLSPSRRKSSDTDGNHAGTSPSGGTEKPLLFQMYTGKVCQR